MSDTPRPEPASRAPKRRSEATRKHLVLKVILVAAVVLSLATGLGVVYLVRHLNGNIEAISMDGLGDRPEEAYAGDGEPLDILVMGSDSRACDGCGIDEEGGGGSDTTILVHLSADGSRAYAISIPRDSIVDRPADGCDAPPAQDVMWNEAYEVNGPTCTLRQFEESTGIRAEHFVVVDFASFGDMVDAVGGVAVCVPADLVDPQHHIFVPKGNPSQLTGDEALDYVRARSVGDFEQQNDISRIRRQQEFIGALVRQVLSAGTLTRLDKVVRFLNAATGGLQTDEEFASVTRLGRLAMELQDIGLDRIGFVTIPTEYFAPDSEFRGRLYWTQDAHRIWELTQQDKALPRKLIDGTSVTAEGPPFAKAPGESQSPPPAEASRDTETPSSTAAPSVAPEPTTTASEQIPGVCA